jgi:hypothetical protein
VHDDDAVLGAVNVELDGIGAALERSGERGDGVLR